MALKPLVKKQLSAWRPITARLVLLRKLVSEFGLEGGSGLAADAIMGFIQVSSDKTIVGLPVDTWPAIGSFRFTNKITVVFREFSKSKSRLSS